MKRIIVAATVALLASAAYFPTAASAQPGLSVVIHDGPPPPRHEVMPPPRHGYEWAPGYWNWDGHRHVWMRGHWEHEHPGRHYFHPEWHQGPDGWHMDRGGWR